MVKVHRKTSLKTGSFLKLLKFLMQLHGYRSKKLVTIDNYIKTIYSLGKEGKRFVEKGLPEKRALKLISERNGTINIKDLSAVLDSDEISVAIGWLITNAGCP